MELKDINIRDPFILADGENYYMYGSRGRETWGKGTGFDVYVSRDLREWSSPHEVFRKPDGFWADLNYWAPEVHKYNGKYYMFASFKSKDKCRGTQILISDLPTGPFALYSDGPVTPRDWECLDGTLYIDKNNVPYMVFCHEWLQVKDGEMCAVQLTSDLKKAAAEPFLLFRASEPPWAEQNRERYVTDGPFLFRASNGSLLMIWSSSVNEKYVEAVAYSDNGEITGKWKHCDELLFKKDGGHGMIFSSLKGELYFVFHSPNKTLRERPVLKRICEKDGKLCIAE